MIHTKQRACEGKNRYPTRTAAQEQIAHLIRRGAPPGRLRAYRCRHCKTWHVGHIGRRRPS